MPTLKSYALTTASRLATFMGLTYSDLNSTKQNLLTDICNMVTELIEGYCGRRFILGTVSNEEYDTNGGNIIALKRFPVTSVTSLQFRNSGLNEDDWETIDTQYYTTDLEAGIIRGMAGYRFAGGRGAFRVSYIGGYDFNNTTTFLADTTAGDVEFAAWKLGAAMYNNRQSSGVTAERIGDYSVTYSDKQLLEDEEIAQILDKYRVGSLVTGNAPIDLY